MAKVNCGGGGLSQEKLKDRSRTGPLDEHVVSVPKVLSHGRADLINTSRDKNLSRVSGRACGCERGEQRGRIVCHTVSDSAARLQIDFRVVCGTRCITR